MLLRAAMLAVMLATTELAAPVLAAPTPQPVLDTSYTTTNGDRAQRLSVTVPAPAAAVWQALDSADGWKSWAVAVAFVDFRPGGQIETNYSAGAKAGDRDNIKNQILAIVPERLLAFRNVQAARDFKDAEMFGRVTTVIELETAGPGVTRVTISGIGYGQGPAWDALYSQFLAGNRYSLEKLKARFEPTTARP